jgi:hypothetical protein
MRGKGAAQPVTPVVGRCRRKGVEMWEVLVALVRLPVTLALLILGTVVGLPFIFVFGIGAWIFGYVGVPFVLVVRLFANEKEDFKKYVANLESPLSEMSESIESMYRGIFKWGFPFK